MDKSITQMKKAALIPARYAATRFPAKLMQMLGDKTVIRHTYDNTVATGLFDEVIVATDSDIIYYATLNRPSDLWCLWKVISCIPRCHYSCRNSTLL